MNINTISNRQILPPYAPIPLGTFFNKKELWSKPEYFQVRQEYATFEEYCRERCNKERLIFHRLIESPEVLINLLCIGNKLENEAQTRLLTNLKTEEQ